MVRILRYRNSFELEIDQEDCSGIANVGTGNWVPIVLDTMTDENPAGVVNQVYDMTTGEITVHQPDVDVKLTWSIIFRRDVMNVDGTIRITHTPFLTGVTSTVHTSDLNDMTWTSPCPPCAIGTGCPFIANTDQCCAAKDTGNFYYK